MQSNQLTLKMLRDFLAVVIFTSLIGDSSTLTCNECNSFVDECTEDEPGRTEECAPDHGCLISLETGGDADVFIRMCSEAAGKEDKCINDGTLKSCMCSSDLCNKNWVDAGFTDTTDTTTTEPAPIKCYSCDSTQGECDKTHTGTEIDCAADFGCVINEDKELFFRGCAVDVKGCIDEADTRTCDCQTELCNFDWASAGAEDKIKCYSCDSKDGDCDEDHPGIEMDCPVEEGCTISKDKDLFFRGCSVEGVGGIGCQEDGETRTCNCMAGLCNNNWVDAGYASSDTTTTQTTPAGPTMKCYKCDSIGGGCTEEDKGEEVDCPETNGCTIRKTVTNGGTGMIRDCSSESDVLCDTIDNGDDVGGTTQFCNCNSPLCNADWSTAGSTSGDSTTTTSSISTTSTTTTTTSASPEAANKAFPLTLGIVCALFRLL